MARIKTIRVCAGMVVAVLVGLGVPGQKVAAAHRSENLESPLGSITSSAPRIAHSSAFGGYAFSVSAADFNGDGKLDLVTANDDNSGTVSIFLSNGDGTFQSAGRYASGGANPVSVAVADFNHDGKLDLAVGNYCNGGCSQGIVGVMLGNGDGTFGAVQTYNTGTLAGSLNVGDFNGDGNPDLAVAQGGQITVMLGKRNGTFELGQSFPTAGWYLSSVQVADLNGDHKQDLVLASSCSGIDTCANGSAGISVLLGNGDGTFQAALPYAFSGWITRSMVVGDFDGDGKPDVAVAVVTNCRGLKKCSSNTVNILMGNGDGTFRPGTTYISGGSLSTVQYGVIPMNLLVTGDFNNDHKVDLAVVNPCASNTNCNNSTLRVFLGKGNGTFKVSTRRFALDFLTTSIATGNFNADANPDLVVAAFDGTSVLPGNGKGVFQIEP
jgi:FG-GAP-like repeat